MDFQRLKRGFKLKSAGYSRKLQRLRSAVERFRIRRLRRRSQRLQDRGEFEKGLPLVEEILARCRTVLGDDSPDTLESIHDLAFSHQTLGQFQRALPLWQEAWDKSRKVLGETHQDTFWTANSVAACYYALGDYQRAASLMEETLAKVRTSLGEVTDNAAAFFHPRAKRGKYLPSFTTPTGATDAINLHTQPA